MSDKVKEIEHGPITTFIENKQFSEAAELLKEYHNVDIAHTIDRYEAEDIFQLLNEFPIDDQAEIFSYLPHNMQMDLADELSTKTLTAVLKNMSPDDRADFFNQLPEGRQESLLPILAKAERDDIRRLTSYEEGSTGAVMTSDYVTLSPAFTCREALAKLREQAEDKETIYNSYVVDENRRVLGVISLHEIILAPPYAKIEDLMGTNVISAYASDSKEETVRKIAKYDFLAIPVLDTENRLVGIVTYDDAMDVAEEAATEDFHKGATIGKMVGRVRDASLFHLYKNRIVWLVLLVFGNIFSGAGIAFFEDVISEHIALVFFLPLLIDSGGNAGSQSATLMVRALATGDVVMRDWARLIGREVIIAFGLGLTMAIAVYGIGVYRGGFDVAMVISLTMVVIVMVGSLIGMSLPFILSRLNLDPAAASAPLVTSMADISGVLIYFSLANFLLNIA